MYSSSSVFIIYLNKWLLESLFDLLFFKISDHQIFCQTYIPFRINRDSSLSSLRLAQSIKIMAWDNYTFLTDWQSNESVDHWAELHREHLETHETSQSSIHWSMRIHGEPISNIYDGLRRASDVFFDDEVGEGLDHQPNIWCLWWCQSCLWWWYVDEDPTSDILEEENDASFIGSQEVDVITLNLLTMFRRLANLTLKLVLQIRVEKSLASHEIWVTPTICFFKMISI